MEKEELQKKLNKEYKGVGEITIESMTKGKIDSNKISYVSSVMDKIEPLESEEPIVVAKRYFNYKLIDGYHRLKGKLGNEIESYILTDYSIKRSYDCFFDFIKKREGKTITFIDSQNLIVGSKRYFIEFNEGCGGCSNGWSSIDLNNKFKNKKIKANSVESKNKEGDLYDLYINDKFIAKVDTGWGNGYYGGDFNIKKI